MLLKALFKKNQDYSEEVSKARAWLNEADVVIVGIGGGLSAAGGIDFAKPHLLKMYFKDYYRMGYRKMSELLEMYSKITDANAKAYWGYWARYIKHIGYEFEVSNGYKDLLRLIRNKDYWIYTTNIDTQVQRTGFNQERIFAMQGDCRFLKCSKSCQDETYESEMLLEGMIKSMGGNLEIDGRKVPRCPHCGAYLVPNLEMKKLQWSSEISHLNFLKEEANSKIVFLEIGVGAEVNDMQSCFEKMTETYAKARWIRINKNEAKVPETLKEKVIGLEADAEEIMADLTAGMISL